MGGRNLADLLEQVAASRPERPAVVTPRCRLTYGALIERAHRFANVLAEVGVGADAHIGLALHNNADHLAALFGAFAVRAVPINVNLRYTTAEWRALFAGAELAAVVHEPELAGRVEQAAGPEVTPDRRLARGAQLDARLAHASATAPDVGRSGDDHYLLFTGGTTGTPKGVLWRHEDLYISALQGSVPVDGSRVRLLPASPLTHGTAQWTTLMTLLSGGTVVLAPSGTFDPAGVWTLAERERVTHLVIVGDAFARPLVEALDNQPHRWDLSELLVVASGGAALSGPMRDALLDHLPGAAVVDGYGTSETGGGGQMAVFPGQRGRGLLRFTPDERTAVLDDDLRPITPGSGAVGRLARTGNLPLGYLNDPDRTDRTFVERDGRRWAIPGDLATVDAEGRVVLLGRTERIINTGGEKIFAEEVEAVLVEHPAVLDVAVVGVPDERWGERVTALVTFDPDRSVHPAELIDHCRARLAGFKAPRQVEVVDRIPRLANGKPDHRWARMVAAHNTRTRQTIESRP